MRNPAIEVSEYKCKAKKILRLHAGEAFSPLIYYTDFSKFDLIIFVAEHIKDFVESKRGKLDNAVIIPVGVGVNGYIPNQKKSNKIAYAGDLSRKKGVGELLLIAKSLPEYEFHIAGKFSEEDIADYFNKAKPYNIKMYPFRYDLKDWLKEFPYYLNTSMREGNPITVLEAMSVGCQPLVKDWVGAKEIYGDNVYSNIDDLKRLLNKPYNPQEHKNFVDKHYNFNDTLQLIKEAIQWKS